MSRIFERYKREFTEKASLNGYSNENITKCLNYAEVLVRKDLPIIYNTSHLGGLVGYNVKYLGRAALYPKYFYRKFDIPKSNGDMRTLFEPLPSLKEVQTWILEEILYKNKVSKYAKAYVPKRSIKDHVKYHDKQETVVTLDIKSFFDSIKDNYVEKLFLEMGYSKNISNLLTKLCFLNGGLPQGAPTSPYLSNLVLYDFDEEISKYCSQNNLKYTRYADDMAFSGRINSNELIKLVKTELRKVDLLLNNDKTRVMSRNQPQIISGIVVNDKCQVPKEKRNTIRNEMFYIMRFGLKSHMERTNQNKENYLKHLIGRINYLLIMNPKDQEFIDYKQFLYDKYKGEV